MRDRAGAVEPNDVTLRVDTARPGECGPRDIDVSERTLVKQEGMKGPSDAVEANDVAPRVDTAWQGGRGPRDINRGEVRHLGTHGHE